MRRKGRKRKQPTRQRMARTVMRGLKVEAKNREINHLLGNAPADEKYRRKRPRNSPKTKGEKTSMVSFRQFQGLRCPLQPAIRGSERQDWRGEAGEEGMVCETCFDSFIPFCLLQNVEEAFKQAARNVHANFQANRSDASARSGLMSDAGRATVVPTSPNSAASSTRNCCIIV